METGLKYKTVVVYLLQPASYRYAGEVLQDTEEILVLTDERTGRDIFINKSNIGTIEVLK